MLKNEPLTEDNNLIDFTIHTMRKQTKENNSLFIFGRIKNGLELDN